jgi:GTP cyclohydrolase I
MTHQIADSLARLTHAHGVAVYLEAEHLCTQMRGVREVESRTRTTAYHGVYERDTSLRAEFRDICGIGRGPRS